MQRNIITIATGKQLYVDLAINLYHSFLWWHPGTDITFYIITDQPGLIKTLRNDSLKIITVKQGELGEGFSPKLHIDKLAPEGQTLFIDSDCLIFGKLDRVFEIFKGRAVSVIGAYISNGEWFGDIDTICKQFNVHQIPKFNGGIYYLEKGDKASAVYTKARELETSYDEIGFKRLRNRPNDEVIMALAMQLEGQSPVIDDGTVMSDPQACPGGYFIDVINGKRWLLNPPPPDPRHRSWYPFEKVNPLVVHFLGYYTQHFPYRLQTYRLNKALMNNLFLWNEIAGRLIIQYPEQLKNVFKNIFRPAFHSIFGTRKIKQSDRIV